MSSDISNMEVVSMILIGTNGTGKSTVLRKIMEASQKRVLVIPSNSSEPSFKHLKEISADQVATFTGHARYMCYDPSDLEAIASSISNCTLISDDFRNYLDANVSREVRGLFIERRHKGIDMYLAAHGFTQVPPVMWAYLDLIMIFRTKDNPHRYRNHFQNYEEMIQVIEEVNHLAESNPYAHQIVRNG